MQIFSAISNLQRRLLLIQSGINDAGFYGAQIGNEILDGNSDCKNSSDKKPFITTESSEESLYVEEPPQLFGINAQNSSPEPDKLAMQGPL